MIITRTAVLVYDERAGVNMTDKEKLLNFVNSLNEKQLEKLKLHLQDITAEFEEVSPLSPPGNSQLKTK